MHFSIVHTLTLLLFLHISNELRLEINLNDVSGSKVKAKLICGPVKDRPPAGKEQQIWWQGSKFGDEELKTLHEHVQNEALVPDIRVNSTDRYRCFLMSPKADIDKKLLKKRIHRELSASVPAEFGSCSPGYRLQQDRCFPCTPGSYTSGQENECSLCPRDFYNNKEAADSCWPCPEGKKTVTEGADSEDLCVYIDTSGRPVSTLSTKLLVIGICAVIFIVTAWVVIAIYLFWWWRSRKSSYILVDRAESGTFPRDGSAEDHIYAEIRDINEEPKIPSDDNAYVEIIPSDEAYEEPKKPSKDNTYMEIIRDENAYEPPKIPSKEDLYTELLPPSEEPIYEEIKGPEDGNTNYESLPSTSKDQLENKQDKASENDNPNRKSSKITQDEGQSGSGQHLYEDRDEEAHFASISKEHRYCRLKSGSSGFQPLLPPVKQTRPKIRKSDYNKLAEIILKTSKSETDALASNKVPNLEELGYDVQKLSQLIQDLSKVTSKDETRVSKRRYCTDKLPEVTESFLHGKVVKDGEIELPKSQKEDRNHKNRHKKDRIHGKTSRCARHSSRRVESHSEAKDNLPSGKPPRNM